jgi:quercetin dioxygenase-like cupin family protein
MHATLDAAEQLSFLNTRVAFAVSHSDGADGLSVVWSHGPRGDSPPLHVHTTEDEVFHVIDGQLQVSLGGRLINARRGDTLLAPKGVPHTYRVDSESATWLAITTNGDFERFVRRLARADAGAVEHEQVMEAAADSGIDFVGPPLS